MSKLKEKNAEKKTADIGKKALERLQSPDDLDKYLRMTTSGIWVTVIACIAILAGIGAWAFFGSVADRITLQGFVGADGIICFVDSDTALRIKEGDFAYVDGVAEKVIHVEEWASEASRYAEEGITDLQMRQMVGDVEMIYPIIISDSRNLEMRTRVQVAITVDQKTPASMIFGKK